MALEIGAPSTTGAESEVRKGVFLSPSGKRIEFDTVDVQRSVELRGTVFSFPRYGGDYVQRTGRGSTVYPLVAHWSGQNHARRASEFEAAMLEGGMGRLEHPFYGSFACTALGTMSRTNALVTNSNQSTVEVQVIAGIESLYPGARLTAQSEIQAQLDSFGDLAADGLDQLANVDTEAARQSLGASLRSSIGSFGDAIDSVSGIVGEVRAGFTDLALTANEALDVFVGKPILLARQIVSLYHAPADIVDALDARLDAYGVMIDDLIGSKSGSPSATLASGSALAETRIGAANAFHATDLAVLSALTGMVASILGSTDAIDRRDDAIGFALIIDAALAKVTAWRDDGMAALQGIGDVSKEFYDFGATFRVARDSVFATIGRLMLLGASLQVERSMELSRDRNPIELCSELLGSVDEEVVDLFCERNQLSGDEMLIIQKGRKVVY